MLTINGTFYACVVDVRIAIVVGVTWNKSGITSDTHSHRVALKAVWSSTS